VNAADALATSGALTRLAEQLRQHPGASAVHESRARLAAVLALFRVTEIGADPELLFIKRADRAGDPWSGQIALPGGRWEHNDASLERTAIRETREEIGIDVDADGVMLGTLDDLAPRTRSLPPIVVRPYVAVIKASVVLTPNHEVAAYFWAPCRALLDPVAMGEHAVRQPPGSITLPSITIKGHVIWGMTERIIRQLLPRIAAS